MENGIAKSRGVGKRGPALVAVMIHEICSILCCMPEAMKASLQ